MNIRALIHGLSFATLSLIIACNQDSPEADPDPVAETTVTTRSITRTGLRSVATGGQVTADPEVEITSRGVCWSETPAPTISDSKTSDSSGSGTFSSEIRSLALNTNFFLRAYAIGPDGPVYGNEVEFSTKITSSLSGDSSATNQIWLSGAISEELEAATKFSGLCWDTQPTPVVAAGKNFPLKAGPFEVQVNNLTPNTKYYFRTFMIMEKDTLYSVEVTESTLPAIVIAEPEAIGARHAIGAGELLEENGQLSILAKGICFSTSESPTVDDHIIEAGANPDDFSYIMRSLTANNTYYVRAYATNESGTAYSEEVSLTTPADQKIIYTLNMVEDPTADQLDAYIRLTHSMNTAVEYYNDYSDHQRNVWVNYNPGVATADANIEGWMRFGSNRSYMNVRTCLHELAHTVGIGTSTGFDNLMVDGIWTGPEGNKTVKELTGDPNAVINRYGVHIGPFGLNYDSEGTSHEDFVNHCLLLESMRKDGL